jgi:phosphate transport system permease protein
VNRRTGERIVELAITTCGVSAVALVLAIFAFIGREGLGFLLTHGAMLTQTAWEPTQEPPSFGLLALLLGTLWVVGLALAIAVPLGLAAAVWLAEFAPPRLRDPVKVVVELLAAVPSVVWGFLGVMVLGPALQALGAPVGLNALNGALLLALMTLPLIVSLGEDALRAVPDSCRQAGLALGATRGSTGRRADPAGRGGRATSHASASRRCGPIAASSPLTRRQACVRTCPRGQTSICRPRAAGRS